MELQTGYMKVSWTNISVYKNRCKVLAQTQEHKSVHSRKFSGWVCSFPFSFSCKIAFVSAHSLYWLLVAYSSVFWERSIHLKPECGKWTLDSLQKWAGKRLSWLLLGTAVMIHLQLKHPHRKGHPDLSGGIAQSVFCSQYHRMFLSASKMLLT